MFWRIICYLWNKIMSSLQNLGPFDFLLSWKLEVQLSWEGQKNLNSYLQLFLKLLTGYVKTKLEIFFQIQNIWTLNIYLFHWLYFQCLAENPTFCFCSNSWYQIGTHFYHQDLFVKVSILGVESLLPYSAWIFPGV